MRGRKASVLEHRVDPLEDHRHPLEAHAGVNARPGEGDASSVGSPVELHEDEVPDLEEPLAVLNVGRAVGITSIDQDLRAGAARPHVAHAPRSCPFSPRPTMRVAGRPATSIQMRPACAWSSPEHRDPEPVGGNAEAPGQQLPAQCNGLLLEVVPKKKLPSISKKVWCRGEVPRIPGRCACHSRAYTFAMS